MTKEQQDCIFSELKEYITKKQFETKTTFADICYTVIHETVRLYGEQKELEIKPAEPSILDADVRKLNFSIRALNAMWVLDIRTVRDLVRYSYKFVSQTRNVGKKTMIELNDFITEHNLTWNMDV